MQVNIAQNEFQGAQSVQIQQLKEKGKKRLMIRWIRLTGEVNFYSHFEVGYAYAVKCVVSAF